MKLVIYILTILALISCNRGLEITELYVQKIPESNKRIYQYGAWSTLNDGAKYGFAILDSNDLIDIVAVEQMPFRVFAKLPNKNSLSIITNKNGGNRIPQYTSTTVDNYKGFTVTNICYEYSGGPTNIDYRFSDFKETNDSLFLYGLEKEYFNLPNSSNEIGFLKGNIKLVELDSLKGIVQKIQIFAYILDSINAKSFIDQVIIRDSNLKVNGLVKFSFYPTKKIKTKEFTNYGIYKKNSELQCLINSLHSVRRARNW